MRSSRNSLKRLKELGWWYQHFTLPCGLRTGDGQEPAYDPELRWNLFKELIPADLTGKTVLDLGGCSGYFSIQMKLRGAARCVLVEPYREFLEQARFAASEFGVEIEFVAEDAHTFCLTREEHYDYILFLGLLYHLRHPLLVIDRLAEMTRERLVVASAIIGPEKDDSEPGRDFSRADDETLLSDPAHPRLAFIENRYYGDPTNWWLPNYAALPAMLRAAGMRVVARPHAHIVVAEPEIRLGTVVYEKLVFSRYAKPGDAAVFPGPQRVDAGLWTELCLRNEAHIQREEERLEQG
ncbi:MAG: DUF1698 domain-containing protein [Bryobacteraceae bacterium]|nr:DUF1698 domain-containing protein [Bryobacteraceae bacterium]